MESLGMSFMSAGLESFLAEFRRQEQTVLDIIADLTELEYILRKERSAKSRLKLSGMLAVKRLPARHWTVFFTMPIFSSLQGDSYRMKDRLKAGIVNFCPKPEK